MFPFLIIAALSAGPVEVRGWLATEVESAHVSIGRIKNDYPALNFDSGLRFDGSDFGYLDFGIWSECDLCNHNRRQHRWAFHEIDPKIGYGYRFGIADGWTFDSSVAAQWNLMSGYYGPLNKSYDEWQVREALETPWMTAYYSMRNFYWPVAKASCRFGIMTTIPLGRGLSLAPDVFCEGGSQRWNTQRFRQREDWTVGCTVNSLQLRLTLSCPVTEWFSLYGGVTGYFVVDPKIRSELDRGSGFSSRKELAIVTLGTRMVF